MPRRSTPLKTGCWKGWVVRRLALLLSGLAVLSAVVVAVSWRVGRETAATKTTSATCPFISDLDGFVYDLPKHMSREQVEACQRYFAHGSPDDRFAPGSPAFSTRFCSAREHRHPACQQVRVAMCRLAVTDGSFTNLRACLAAAPAVRRVVRIGGASISVLVLEPWYFWTGVSLHLSADNEIRFAHAFPNLDGWITFLAPTRTAWDSRAARKVPFPASLADFLAGNPYLRVLATRTLHLPGMKATEIDLLAVRGDPKAREQNLCGELGIRDEPCVPVTADSDSGYTTLALKPGWPHRVIDVRTASGRVIVVVSQFYRFSELTGVERILRTLRGAG